jgi:hypothetical protein
VLSKNGVDDANDSQSGKNALCRGEQLAEVCGVRRPVYTKERALAALIASRTIKEAALICGISERTLRGWMAQDDFAAAFRKERHRLLDHATTRMVAALDRAVAVLVENMEEESAGERRQAAVALLDRATSALELQDVIRRVEALEQGKR